MAHAHIHILGSRAGYTTLDATQGVTTAERAELEVLSFGDATSAEIMTRLETHASMIGRRLRSGRFAISRMLPGGIDDAGRPTIEVVSLLVDESSYTAVVGSLERLASDVRLWRVARGAVSRGYEIPEQSTPTPASDPRVLRAFDTWLAARKQGGIAVLAEADGLFAMVGLLDAEDLAQCRWGVGVLSLSAPVDICTLAPTTAAIGPRPVLRAPSHGPWLNNETNVAVQHAARNPLLPASTSLAQAMRIEPTLGGPARATTAWSDEAISAATEPRRRNLLPMAAISAGCSLMLLSVLAVVYARGGAQADASRPAATESLDPAAAVSTEAQAAPTPMTSVGYGEIEAIEPPQPDSPPADAAQLPPVDQNQPALFKKEFFRDADGDGIGAGDPITRQVTADIKRIEVERMAYVDIGGDECPESKLLTKPVSYFLDEDRDGVGAGSAVPYCEQSNDGRAVRDGKQWVVLSGDECDENKFRTSVGDCGCDWYAPDADLDGNNVQDCIDDAKRREALEIVFGTEEKSIGLRAARKQLDAARDALNVVLERLENADGSRRRDEIAGILERSSGSVMQARYDIEAALRTAYDLRVQFRFGSVEFAPRMPDGESPPAVMDVATLAEFDVLEHFMRSASQASDRLLRIERYKGLFSGESLSLKQWRDQLEEFWEGNFYVGNFKPRVARWVFGFMTPVEKEIADSIQQERDAFEAAVRKAPPSPRGRKPTP